MGDLSNYTAPFLVRIFELFPKKNVQSSNPN